MDDRSYLCRDEEGRSLKPDYVTQKHKSLLEEHGLLHRRFHDLRHSCATMLLAQNVSLDKIKEWIRHSDINITMRYAHQMSAPLKTRWLILWMTWSIKGKKWIRTAYTAPIHLVRVRGLEPPPSYPRLEPESLLDGGKQGLLRSLKNPTKPLKYRLFSVLLH